jgi:superfamily II DNA/RNA helicase
MTMDQHAQFRWSPKKGAADIIREHMQPAIYVSKREAMPDMPPIMMTQREVDLSYQQKKLIKELKKNYISTVGEAGITAVHAAALKLKIVQIASGSVYDDLGQEVHLDNASRDAELLDIVRQVRAREFKDGTANNKVVVFCAFKHTVHRVVAFLVSNGVRAAALTGDNSTKQRDTVIDALQKGTELEVLVAIADIAAHGLTFTAASTTVWYSPVTKAELYIQANNRMDRPGQKQHMEITRIYACEAEKIMYNGLSDKVTGQSDVLSGYKQLVESL